MFLRGMGPEPVGADDPVDDQVLADVSLLP